MPNDVPDYLSGDDSSLSERLTQAPPRGHLAADEAFFRRRGLPLLIENYSATGDVLTRALPFLVFITLVETGLAIFQSWSRLIAAGLAALVVIIGVGAWMAYNRLRGRYVFAPPERVGWWVAGAFVVAPSVVGLASDRGPQWALQLGLQNLAIAAVVVAIIGWGLVPTLFWAFVRVLRDLAGSLTVMLRAMSVVSLFAVLIFFTLEFWQLSQVMTPTRMYQFEVLMTLLVLAVIVMRTPDLVREVLDTDMAGSTGLRRSQRVNIGLLIGVRQIIQVFVLVLMASFGFAIFGLLIIPPDLYKTWELTYVVIEEFHTGSEVFILTDLLVDVSQLVALLAGLNFAVALATGEDRGPLVHEMVRELRPVFERRNAYLEKLKEMGTSGPDELSV